MRYVLLLFGDESVTYGGTADVLRDHDAFAAYAMSRGVTISDHAALHDSVQARTLRPTADGIVVSDGPYAALKEQIGGYYIFEAPSFDEALDVAKACPRYAGTELRPVWEIPS